MDTAESNPVPWLREGTGVSPQDGGCVMQVIDWISTGGWTDEPRCVYPELREIAIVVNDDMSDEGRQRLLDLVPRLMNTAYPRPGGYDPLLDDQIEQAVNGWHYAVRPAPFTEDEFQLGLLTAAIDAYDRFTGRPKAEERIDFAAVCEVMRA